MQTIDMIKELLSHHPHIFVNGSTVYKNTISFLPIKHQNHRHLNYNIVYKAQCNADEVKFISTKVNNEGSLYLNPKEYVLLNIDLKHPGSINVIHEFLRKLQ
jgi:hypothetical protein